MVAKDWRKEVGLDRLSTLAILAALGAAAPALAADATPATPPATSATPSPRPEPPEAPIKYLEAGAKLFNKGRYDLAAKYLGAAHDYRDRLTPNQRIVLDVYREQLDDYRGRQAAVPAGGPKGARTDDGVRTASTVVAAPTSIPMPMPKPVPLPAFGPVPPAGPGAVPGTETWRETTDVKQKARWLVQQSRSQIFHGELDAAAESLARADALGAKWTRFDDTPAKVAESLNQARLRAPGSGSVPVPDADPSRPRDRRAAQALLKSARSALAGQKFESAEAIARDVKSWGLRYGLLDDTPEKVAAAAAAARRQAASKDAGLMEGMLPGVPDQGANPTGPH